MINLSQTRGSTLLTARKSTHIFLAVQKALFFRELGMRFTSGKSGLFWTFFEPFMQVFIYSVLRAMIFNRDNGQYDYTVFIALNFIAFNLFKNIAIRSMNAFSANKGLFLYKQVKPIDTIFARALVEIYITGIIIVAFLLLAWFFGVDIQIENLPMVALGYGWLILFGIALGILLATVNIFFQSVGKIINMSTIFLIFGSAIFFTIESLPPLAQKVLLYNPLVHFMELIHGEFFIALDTHFVSYDYMTLWTLGPGFIGLWLYRYNEEKIISL